MLRGVGILSRSRAALLEFDIDFRRVARFTRAIGVDNDSYFALFTGAGDDRWGIILTSEGICGILGV